MRGIINNIILYEMRAQTLGILVANTQKALGHFGQGAENISDRHTERLTSLVNDLTTDMRDMLTRFWFLKERKQKKNEPMTGDQVDNLANFADFTKALTKDIRSLVARFQKAHGRTFEKKFDKELKQIETHVKKRLKEFDRSLEDTLAGTRSTCKEGLREYVGKGM